MLRIKTLIIFDHWDFIVNQLYKSLRISHETIRENDFSKPRLIGMVQLVSVKAIKAFPEIV